jgi:hypothetical protein
MSTKKTIQINPELFKLPGNNRTKKTREKKELQINPVISPNILKNKLLKRIKEHKLRETKNINTKIDSNDTNVDGINNSYSNEFNSAMNYLSQLTKQNERNKLKNNLLSKTVKNTSNTYDKYMDISLELPPQLQEQHIFQNNNMINSLPLKMNYTPIINRNDVPYGCLKGGTKPSYRNWIQTRKNYSIPINNQNNVMPFIRPPTPPKKNEYNEIKDVYPPTHFLAGATTTTKDNYNSNMITREERLEKIRNKLKKIDEEELIKKRKEIDELNTIGKELGLIDDESDKELDDLPDFEENGKQVMPELSELLEKREIQYEKENPKSTIKKTVKRKFTLGKSDKLRKVAILVKDKKTRKNILNAQKKLKKTHINDVRKYLRQHGIIKAGTTCPQDILRKMFESAMLAGEITNTNKDVILHNFINSDKF